MSINSKGKLRQGLSGASTKLPPLGKSGTQVAKVDTKRSTQRATSNHSLNVRQTINSKEQSKIKNVKVPNANLTSTSVVTDTQKIDICVAGSPYAKQQVNDEQFLLQKQHSQFHSSNLNGNEKSRGKDGNKMSLVCDLKLKTLRKEHNYLKQTLPPTDDVVEILRERAALDNALVQSLKKKAITTRWDVVIDYVQRNPQPGIFGLWEYIMARGGNELLQSRLQETFNIFVNQHFDRDLQNLQLNKDRQNRVAKVMLENMEKAEGYIDSLNLSIWEYQRYTEKISSLVKESEKVDEKVKQSPDYIRVVFQKLANYVTTLEQENLENTEEIEGLKIKLYESNGEIERLQYEAKRIRMDNQDKAKHIKSLQSENKAVNSELEITKRKMTDIENDKQGVNRKLDEMMNLMVKNMESMKEEIKIGIQQEVGTVKDTVQSNLMEMESRMTARLDEVQENIDVVQEGQDNMKEEMTKIERNLENSANSRKIKDKKVNLNINIKAGTAMQREISDDIIKTRSDKLKNIQGK